MCVCKRGCVCHMFLKTSSGQKELFFPVHYNTNVCLSVSFCPHHQVITLEGWVDIMYYVMDAHSFYNFIYFILLIIVSTFLYLFLYNKKHFPDILMCCKDSKTKLQNSSKINYSFDWVQNGPTWVLFETEPSKNSSI